MPACADRPPALVLAVHGSRDERAAATARALAATAAEAVGAPPCVGFADIAAPDVGAAAALACARHGSAVVVPAFLASGYHVRTDIPGQLARAGCAGVPLAPALDDEPAAEQAAARRLRAAGHRAGEPVVLAAAGSTRASARSAVQRAAHRLAQRIGAPVRAAFLTAGSPTPDAAAAALRSAYGGRVWAASWLLAPGRFHDRVAGCGADAATPALCLPDDPDPHLAAALAARYRRALDAARASAAAS